MATVLQLLNTYHATGSLYIPAHTQFVVPIHASGSHRGFEGIEQFLSHSLFIHPVIRILSVNGGTYFHYTLDETLAYLIK